MSKRSNYARSHNIIQSRFDWPLITTFILLMIFSLLTVLSTTYLQFEQGSLRPFVMQNIWYGVGIISAIILAQINYETLFKLAPLGYCFGLLLLAAVLIFYDRDIYVAWGAKSWLSFAGLTFQPSELMKFFYILMLARLVRDYTVLCNSSHYEQLPVRQQLNMDWKFLFRLVLWSLPPFVLVLAQNDFGTMLVFMVILIGVIFVSGISWRIIIPSLLILGAVFSLLLFLVLYDRDLLLKIGFQNYQFSRIDSWLEPFGSTAGESYQLSQSLKAIGSGQIIGKGLGAFEVYVPVRESDMIFATIGENFGFLGSSFLILLFFILIYIIIARSFSTGRSFYATFAAGTVSMLAFHIMENIGMNIGLLPLTGIPLPFISQGGSSLVTCCMCLGVVASIRYQDHTTKKTTHWLNHLLLVLVEKLKVEHWPIIRNLPTF